VEPDRTALLVMDLQDGVVQRLGDPGMLERTATAIAAARASGVRVIYVRVAFRPGYPEVSARNRTFSALSQSGQLYESEVSIHQSVEPADGETIVTKRRVSAFAGSDLDVVLRAGGIESLVLTGIATSGVVLSTVREAADLDFDLIVLGDACADRDDEVHRVLVEKVFPRQAVVTTVGDWAAGLAGGV
jgi:nicotinamidase-related amidase